MAVRTGNARLQEKGEFSMCRTEVYVIVGTMVAAAIIALAGCGGTSSITGGVRPGPVTTWGTETVVLGEPLVDDGLRYRWRDVDSTLYTTDCGEPDAEPPIPPQDFQTAYSYADASVSASFATPAEQLVVTLTGTGLKPNFAYQLKLEGLPQEDPTANGILRNLGRRWRNLGYLIFGYFVTDKEGKIVTCASSTWNPDTSIPVDSSYHVLWRLSRTPGDNDGPVITHNIIQTCFGYDGNGTGDTVGVYGEWEPGRPTPGTLVLPEGSYTCLLRLTEETFHEQEADWDSMWDGWKSVLDAQISFTIGSGGGPGPETHDVAVTEIGVSPRIPVAGQPAVVAVTVLNEGTEAEETDVSLADTSDGSATVVPSAAQPVSLSPGASATLEFTWTPEQTGFHVLEASASQVPEETDTADNVKSRKVKVR
jgi:hypothetical protein